MPKSNQLTARQVRSIRLQHQAGNTITAISEAYRRSRKTIADLIHGRTYMHVPDDMVMPELPGQAQREKDRELQRQRALKQQRDEESSRRSLERQREWDQGQELVRLKQERLEKGQKEQKEKEQREWQREQEQLEREHQQKRLGREYRERQRGGR